MGLSIGLLGPRRGFAGGIERHVYELALGLAARGHELSLIHCDDDGQDTSGYAKPFRRVLPVSNPKAAGRLDILYAHRVSGPESLSAFGRLPLVVAAHDHNFTCVRPHRYLPLTDTPCHRAPGLDCVIHGCCVVRKRSSTEAHWGFANPFRLKRELHTIAQIAHFTACSRYIANGLVDAGVAEDHVTVIHPIGPESSEPVQWETSGGRMLFVGQLVRGKGVDLAISALQYLPDQVTLEIAGEGPSRPALERLATAYRGRVVFHGYVPPSVTNVLYDRARVVLVPSRWPEPFGMVGIEAMRRARPVVAASHGGIPEWLDGSGSAGFEPGNPRALARAVLDVLGNPGLGRRVHAHATERFRFDVTIDRVERTLFEQLQGRQ